MPELVNRITSAEQAEQKQGEQENDRQRLLLEARRHLHDLQGRLHRGRLARHDSRPVPHFQAGRSRAAAWTPELRAEGPRRDWACGMSTHDDKVFTDRGIKPEVAAARPYHRWIAPKKGRQALGRRRR
jgi:hypothetical protein